MDVRSSQKDVKPFHKTENIIKAHPEDTLTSVLSLLSSSHDAAFVFDDKTFIGVVNPYYCLFQKSFAPTTKVKNCCIMPPRLNLNDTVERAAKLMMDSRIHYLPVFDRENFMAIISARRIITNILESPKLDITVGEYLKTVQPVITIQEDESISKAINLFKEHKISKLVVISPYKKLVGILALYDLLDYMSIPRERQQYASRAGNKSAFVDTPIKKFYKKNVLTIQPARSLRDAGKMIIDKQIGSVIVIDKKNIPLGIITSKNLLSLYIGKPQGSFIHIYTRHLSNASRTIVNIFSKRLVNMLGKREDVDEAVVTITEKKQGGVFEGVLQVIRKGKRLVIREEGKNLIELLRSLKQRGKNLISK